VGIKPSIPCTVVRLLTIKTDFSSYDLHFIEKHWLSSSQTQGADLHQPIYFVIPNTIIGIKDASHPCDAKLNDNSN